MGARGPKALAQMTTKVVETIARPDAPYDLTDEQADEWRAVVDRMPADWFPRETWGLLSQYCRHVVASRRIAQLVCEAEKDTDFDVVMYDRLLKMQEREGRAMSSLATRMRISQQATYDRQRAKPKVGATRKPWDIEG